MANITYRDGAYRIRISVSNDDGRSFKTMTWRPEEGVSMKDAQKRVQVIAMQFEEEHERGNYYDNNMTFRQFAEKWMNEYAKVEVRSKTYKRYESLLVRINQGIGSIRLSKLQPLNIIEFMNNLAEGGIREDAKYKATLDIKALVKKQRKLLKDVAKEANISDSTLFRITHGRFIDQESAAALCKVLNLNQHECFSPDIKVQQKLGDKTLMHHYRLISVILNTAKYWQMIPSNPIERVKAPRVKKKKAKYLDDIQAIKLLELIRKEDILYHTIVTLLLYTGCRRSEILALKWQDINYQTCKIDVNKSLHYLPERGLYLEDTKTDESMRQIGVTQEVMDLLHRYSAWQKECRLKAGDQWNDDDFVFTAWNGTALRPDNLTHWFAEFIKKTNLPQISIHSLRHTSATLQISAGVPIRTVADRLGHAQTSTTVDIYSHAIKSSSDHAADVLAKVLNVGD